LLSFDLSVIDIALVIAVVVLFMLFLSQRRGQPTNKSELLETGQKKTPEKPKVQVKTAQEKNSTTQVSADSEECVHHFGYLKDLPKNTPVPEECFGCKKILRCLFPNEES
jgi:hypothetical protein